MLTMGQANPRRLPEEPSCLLVPHIGIKIVAGQGWRICEQEMLPARSTLRMVAIVVQGWAVVKRVIAPE
jgi:hypothetical protein